MIEFCLSLIFVSKHSSELILVVHWQNQRECWNVCSLQNTLFVFRLSTGLLTQKLSPWASCMAGLILYHTSGQTVSRYFPLFYGKVTSYKIYGIFKWFTYLFIIRSSCQHVPWARKLSQWGAQMDRLWRTCRCGVDRKHEYSSWRQQKGTLMTTCIFLHYGRALTLSNITCCRF